MFKCPLDRLRQASPVALEITQVHFAELYIGEVNAAEYERLRLDEVPAVPLLRDVELAVVKRYDISIKYVLW